MTYYPHATWAHVMLWLQLGYLTLNSGADSHFCHSAYVTWSDVELWSAHMPARLLNFCWRTNFVRRDVISSLYVSSCDVVIAVGIFNIEFWRRLTLLSTLLTSRDLTWSSGRLTCSTPLKFLFSHTFRETWRTILTLRELMWCYECSWDI
jgi:hypothetical protein